MNNRIRNDGGFMGSTHSLSAIAIYLFLAAFAPSVLFNKILKTNDITVFLSSVILVGGAVLFNDIDNTKSTVISVLGLFGKLLSNVLRSISVVIFNLTKTKYDNKDANPHRGFWHTLAAAVLLYFFFLTTLSFNIPIRVLGRQTTLSAIFAGVYIFVCLQLFLASLFSRFVKNAERGMLNNLMYDLGCALVAFIIYLTIPKGLNYQWMAAAMTLGYVIHILGDTLTVSGTPLLWPLEFKGKRWWNHRIIGIRAGGVMEDMVFAPLFVVIIVYSLFKIFNFLN